MYVSAFPAHAASKHIRINANVKGVSELSVIFHGQKGPLSTVDTVVMNEAELRVKSFSNQASFPLVNEAIPCEPVAKSVWANIS